MGNGLRGDFLSSENNSSLKRIWNSGYTFGLLLALPAIPMILGLASGEFRQVLSPAGEFATRFMIIAMMLTPLIMLFPKVRALRWLMQRRRAIGVAAFGYAALHTIAYVLKEGTLARILAELPELGIWTGWVAMLVFVPLALTSNDWSLRRLGINWKNLQRLVYVAAFFTIAHWIFLEYEFGGALVHFVPLAALELYRVGRNMKWWAFRLA